MVIVPKYKSMGLVITKDEPSINYKKIIVQSDDLLYKSKREGKDRPNDVEYEKVEATATTFSFYLSYYLLFQSSFDSLVHDVFQLSLSRLQLP